MIPLLREEAATMTDSTDGVLRGTQSTAALIARYAASPGLLADAVRGASDADLDRVTGTDEWPARTVLAHLRDDEFMVTRLRIERIVAEDTPQLVPFDEQAWARDRNRSDDARDALVEGFRVQREASVAILRLLSEEDWARVGSQPEIGTFDLRWWVEHCLEHDEMHIAQAARAIAK
jgi:hypothetical protein